MNASSLLWSVVSPQGQASWLFGSMHIRDDRVYQFGARLYPLILQSDAYVGEMDMAASPLILPGKEYDFQKFLGNKAFQKAKTQIDKSFGVNLAMYNHLHPMIVLSGISQRVLASEHQVSLDEHLWNYAASHLIPVSGLESYEEQMTLLHSIKPDTIYKQILNISKSPGGLKRQMEKTMELYLSHNIQQLYRTTKSSMHELRKDIIYKRNQVMAERIHAFPEKRNFSS